MGEDTFLQEYIAIFLYIDTLHKILNQHTFYRLQDTFNISHTHTHTEEYSTDYIRIFVMYPFSCICWYINLILFVLLILNVLLSPSFFFVCFSIRSQQNLWGTNNQPNIPPQNVGLKIFTKQQYPQKTTNVFWKNMFSPMLAVCLFRDLTKCLRLCARREQVQPKRQNRKEKGRRVYTRQWCVYWAMRH